jgi:hypothetical protein
MLHRVASSLIDWVCSFDLIGECRPSSKVIEISAQLFSREYDKRPHLSAFGGRNVVTLMKRLNQ